MLAGNVREANDLRFSSKPLRIRPSIRRGRGLVVPAGPTDLPTHYNRILLETIMTIGNGRMRVILRSTGRTRCYCEEAKPLPAMKLCNPFIWAPPQFLLSFQSALCVLIGVFSASAVCAAEVADAAITGTVSNAATRNMLFGAKVEVPRLGLSAFADSAGRYVVPVPPGAYELVASYTGLDPIRQQVTVGRGQRVVQNFDLTTGIYHMQEFKVTGEREGAAAAITAQRNADNVKNVVAMDSFGSLPNMSAGELAIRMPGVAGNLDDEGNVYSLSVRGMGPSLNRVVVDGALIANVGGMNRQFQMHSMTGAMFAELEVIKGHTPMVFLFDSSGTENAEAGSGMGVELLVDFGVGDVGKVLG